MAAPSFFALWRGACTGGNNICTHFVLKKEDTIIDVIKKIFFACCFSFCYMMTWIFDSERAEYLRSPSPGLWPLSLSQNWEQYKEGTISFCSLIASYFQSGAQAARLRAGTVNVIAESRRTNQPTV